MSSIAYRGSLRIGAEIGRLTIIEGPTFTPNPHGRIARFVCQCTCGNRVTVLADNLRIGHTKSCGCLHSEVIRRRFTTHQETGTRLHRIWAGMIQRCHNPAHPQYADYGGRGIAVSSEWRASYEAFRDWARTAGYTDSLQLDRIDNNSIQGYCPSNCRWVTSRVNNNNRRSNKRLTILGETKTEAQWGRDPRCAVAYGCFHQRLERGWVPEQALLTPRLTAWVRRPPKHKDPSRV